MACQWHGRTESIGDPNNGTGNIVRHPLLVPNLAGLWGALEQEHKMQLHNSLMSRRGAGQTLRHGMSHILSWHDLSKDHAVQPWGQTVESTTCRGALLPGQDIGGGDKNGSYSKPLLSNTENFLCCCSLLYEFQTLRTSDLP